MPGVSGSELRRLSPRFMSRRFPEPVPLAADPRRASLAVVSAHFRGPQPLHAVGQRPHCPRPGPSSSPRSPGPGGDAPHPPRALCPALASPAASREWTTAHVASVAGVSPSRGPSRRLRVAAGAGPRPPWRLTLRHGAVGLPLLPGSPVGCPRILATATRDAAESWAVRTRLRDLLSLLVEERGVSGSGRRRVGCLRSRDVASAAAGPGAAPRSAQRPSARCVQGPLRRVPESSRPGGGGEHLHLPPERAVRVSTLPLTLPAHPSVWTCCWGSCGPSHTCPGLRGRPHGLPAVEHSAGEPVAPPQLPPTSEGGGSTAAGSLLNRGCGCLLPAGRCRAWDPDSGLQAACCDPSPPQPPAAPPGGLCSPSVPGRGGDHSRGRAGPGSGLAGALVTGWPSSARKSPPFGFLPSSLLLF